MIDTDKLALANTPDEAALRWVVRLAGQPSAEDWRSFEQWLSSDPRHADIYAQSLRLWQLSQTPAAQLARENDAALQAIMANGRRKKARARQRTAAWAMAASLVLASLLGLTAKPERWLDDWQADYHSAPGQVLHVSLGDGSQVTLDADSALDYAEQDGKRLVTLRRGAAFFEVRHTGTPFVVQAEGGEVQVLGTRFEVRRQPRDVQVTVEQGRVAVKAAANAEPSVLGASQRVAYHDGQAGEVGQADMIEALAWREGRLSFRRQPLGDVLQALERYYPERILLLNRELAGQKVSADFVSTDPIGALASLQSLLGFRQMTLPGGAILIL